MHIERILEEISKKEFKILDWQLVKETRGANSQIYKLIGEDQLIYALKFYKSISPDDPRNRLKAECDFLTYVNNTPASIKVPRLIASCPVSNWSLLSWIHGEKLQKLSEAHLTQIVNFISDINIKHVHQEISLQAASEASLSPKVVSENLKRRVTKLVTTKPTNDLEQQVSKWINEVLMPESKQQLSLFEKHYHDNFWSIEAMQIIVSPSDVGIHNTIFKKESLYFLDFEYAGMDDLAKFACDWVLQPEHPLNQKEEEYFLQDLSKKFNVKSDFWLNRYTSLKPILKLKWCTIMLNAFLSHKINKKMFIKLLRYYGIEETNS